MDRVVVITGATGGLGRVVASAFQADGARLGLVGRDRGRLDALAADGRHLHLTLTAAGKKLGVPVNASTAEPFPKCTNACCRKVASKPRSKAASASRSKQRRSPRK